MTGEYDSVLTPGFIGEAIVMVFIAIAFGFALVGGICFYVKLVTGWKALARRFPAADTHKYGEQYQRQDGYFGRKQWNQGALVFKGQFLIELAQEGLVVTARFARRSPILVRWSDIRDVAVGDVLGNILTVNYENEVNFTIPNELVTAIQERIPAERFHRGSSLAELIKGRLSPPPA